MSSITRDSSILSFWLQESSLSAHSFEFGTQIFAFDDTSTVILCICCSPAFIIIIRWQKPQLLYGEEGRVLKKKTTELLVRMSPSWARTSRLTPANLSTFDEYCYVFPPSGTMYYIYVSAPVPEKSGGQSAALSAVRSFCTF